MFDKCCNMLTLELMTGTQQGLTNSLFYVSISLNITEKIVESKNFKDIKYAW